jgi:plasmid replication initiation protein
MDGDIYALLKKQEDEKNKKLYLPKTLELANSLFLAFIKNNNLVGLKLCLVLSGAKSQIRYDDELQVKFNVDDLCKVMNITRKELSNNLKKILQVHFTYVNEEGGAGGTVPIHSYSYIDRNKTIVIGVSPLAKRLFTELGKGQYSFNGANANNLMNLQHKHSLRMQLLLELINNFDEDVAKRKRYTLEQLNGYFGVNYANYYELERKILRPVKEEIDSSSSLTFNYGFNDEASGTGRPKIKEVVIDLVQRNSIQGRLL